MFLHDGFAEDLKMENKILQIPLSLNDETGIVEVCYKELRVHWNLDFIY